MSRRNRARMQLRDPDVLGLVASDARGDRTPPVGQLLVYPFGAGPPCAHLDGQRGLDAEPRGSCCPW